MNSITSFIYKNRKPILFFSFCLIYLTLGLYITFYNDFITTQWDVIFDADCPRVYGDLFGIDANHYRIKVHPFMLMLLQPIFHFINGIFSSQRFTLILLNSLTVGITILLIKDIISKITNNESVSLFFSIIYGISFSCLIFVSIPETYIYSTFFTALLINLIFDVIRKQKISNKEIFFIALLTLSAFGINPVTIVPAMFFIIYLLSSLFKDKKIIVKKFLKIFLLMIVLYFAFSLIQKLAFPNSPIFFKGVINEDIAYVNKNNSVEKFYNLANGMYIKPFYSLNISEINVSGKSNGILVFADNDKLYMFVPLIILFIYPLLYILLKKTNNAGLYNKELILLSSILIFYMVCHYYYGNGLEFLYSQNFLIFIIILLGLLYSFCNSKILNFILLPFIIFQTAINSTGIEKVSKFSNFNAPERQNLFVCFLYALVVVYILVYIFNFGRKTIEKYNICMKQEHIISAYYIFILVSAIFIALFLWRI